MPDHIDQIRPRMTPDEVDVVLVHLADASALPQVKGRRQLPRYHTPPRQLGDIHREAKDDHISEMDTIARDL